MSTTNPFAALPLLDDTRREVVPKSQPAGGRIVYYDLETIPDVTRYPPPEAEEYGDIYAADVVKGSVADIKAEIPKISTEQLCKLSELELARDKSRKGVTDAVKAEIERRESAVSTWVKDGSVNPLTCRIVAAAYAIDDHEPVALYAADAADERELLGELWSVLASCRRRCGYNILNFDDTVLGIRSLLLGVDVLQKIDRNRYRNNDAIDLMHLVSPSKFYACKDVARLLGIDIPAGDVDGSQVWEMYESGDDDGIVEYVRSDVIIEREMHRRLSKVFV